MSTPVRWAVAGVTVLLVVALIVWARGDEHHHGDDVGASTRAAVR